MYEVSISGDIDRTVVHNPLTATVVRGYDNNNFVCIKEILSFNFILEQNFDQDGEQTSSCSRKRQVHFYPGSYLHTV